MSQVDNSSIVINKDGLKKTIMAINEYAQENLYFESSLIEKLDDIKSSILIDNKSLNNKSSETLQNMKTIRNNNDGSIKVFNSLIEKYSEAVNVWVEK